MFYTEITTKDESIGTIIFFEGDSLQDGLLQPILDWIHETDILLSDLQDALIIDRDDQVVVAKIEFKADHMEIVPIYEA